MHSVPCLDRQLLGELFRFNACLGIDRFVRGIDYVRTHEFPVLASELLRHRNEPLDYLDVGSGNSIFPVFVASRSRFKVTVVDKYRWVRDQHKYVRRLTGMVPLDGRLRVLEEDFLTASLPHEGFDVITAISVLEHMPENEDSASVARIYRLLKPGGQFLMSSPYNECSPRSYFMGRSLYGQERASRGFFYQRHYNTETLEARILNAAPFVIENLFFLGHYRRFNFAKWFYTLPVPIKGIKVLYSWATPFYAPFFLQLSPQPPSDPRPRASTADTVFVFMRKPA